jgi:ligand-binding sensor protein
MWPFRPERLSQLLDIEEIRFHLGFGAPLELASAVTLVEPAEDGALARFDPEPGTAASHQSPFCSFFRHGRLSGKLAFDGANEECERCEERFARRALAAGDGAILDARCHMGLQDLAAPVVVLEKVIAVLIAGQRVDSEEQRAKIAKGTGKLGKLTRGEVRSLEEANAPVVAAIRPQEGARELLLEQIPRIPRLTPGFRERLALLAGRLSRLAASRFATARRSWEDALLERLLPEGDPVAGVSGELLAWLGAAATTLRRELGLEHLAVFARLPESFERDSEPLALVAESGLAAAGAVEPLLGAPLLGLEPERLPASGRSEAECVERSIHAVSSLISALLPGSRTPPQWKDRLTKCIFVPAVRLGPGLEAVFAFGAASTGTAPRRDDFAFLWRAAKLLAGRYLLGAVEAARSRAALELGDARRKLDELKPKPKPKRGPISPQRFDLRKLLDECLAAFATRAAEQKVSIDSRGLAERLMLEADRPKLKAVFSRVLAHALESARPDPGGGQPSVLLSTRRRKRKAERGKPGAGGNGRIAVVVDIAGRFLSAEEKRRLYDAPPGTPAEPASPPLTFREAQRFLHWHGGRLELESLRGNPMPEEPGGWLGRQIFTVTIPLAP